MVVTLGNLKISHNDCIIECGAYLADSAAEALLVLTALDDRSFLEAVSRSPLSYNTVEGEFLSGLKDRAVDLLTGKSDIRISIRVVGGLSLKRRDKAEVIVDLGNCESRLSLLGNNANRTLICP